MKQITLFISVVFFSQIHAAELFGVNLSSATRDELRAAVKNAGVKLVSEAGVDAFFDTYKGDAVLHRANYLYLGFVKKDKKFAFAEYEFNGLKQPVLLQKLNRKYGPAKPEKGKFMTDLSYTWTSEGIKISFFQDWKAYKTRLTYYNAEALDQLRNEQKLFTMKTAQQKAVYQEKAY